MQLVDGDGLAVPGDSARLSPGGAPQMVGDAEIFEAIVLFVWRMFESGKSESKIHFGGFRFEIHLGDGDLGWFEKSANEVEGFGEGGGTFGRG